ncbi:MAG: YgiQ family radical SAM protein [Syntrophobacterales bacterium]|jgi:uncharacterized radical SAM protein YgiQ|nr:YgiQ family radical SAM protein [Syntrophobacterales bacterium]
MFLPTTPEELKILNWNNLDIILVTGDVYIDSPFMGISVIGRILLNAGFRVGIIAQPNIHTAADITRLGIPRLFWGVTGGCIDSMAANYTAAKKKKHHDDMTPGGKNTKRPDRALSVYTRLIRSLPENEVPIVLGGLEASLRRIAHYDYWNDQLHRSILCDAPADYLLYGMADKTVLELANCLEQKQDPRAIRGLAYLSDTPGKDFEEIPSFESAAAGKDSFRRMFHLFYENNNSLSGKGICQKQDHRYLIQNPPPLPLFPKELDDIHNLPFMYDVHPFYKKQGSVKALATIQFSIATHRGCYGECSFCSIAVHQGRILQERSETSVMAEAARLTKHPDFKGYLHDIGGPTANMYGTGCKRNRRHCFQRRCLHPQICPQLSADHGRQRNLLARIRKIKGVKKAFVASGIRYDLILHDKKNGVHYLHDILRHHTSGQLKVAPEHIADTVLQLMKKPAAEKLLLFKELFDRLNQSLRKKQFLTYYFIAAHPGCRNEEMLLLNRFVARHLKTHPEQVQIFTPLPSTYSSVMYYTGQDPFTGKPVFVEKDLRRKEKQKDLLMTGRKKL